MNDLPGVDLAALDPDGKRALLARLLVRAGGMAETPAATAPQRFPLSHAQRRLWFIDRLQVGRGAYVIPAVLRIRGALDGERLQRALSAIVARHEILRARFPEHDGEPCVEILPAEPFALMRLEAPAAARTEAALRAEIEGQLRAMLATSFDLAAGRLLRASLLRVDHEDHVLLLGVHHIVADYWSMRVLSREIAAVYAADGAGTLPPLPIQYVDYAVWQRDHTRHLDAQFEYWRVQLASLPLPLALPCDKPRPPVQTSAGMRLTFRVDAGVSAAIRSLARTRRVSVFTTLLAALQALLYRYTGQEDLCVGTIVSNRDRAETRDLIGLFVNNLVLRARLDADLRFGELLQQAHATALAGFAHQDLPFEQLVDALNVERRLDRHPLFQVIFVLHNTPAAGLELPGLDFRAVEVDTFSTRFDLGLDMVDGDGPLSGTFEFSTELFEAATIEGMIASFLALLAAVCDRPDAPLAELDLRPASEPHSSVQYRGPDQTALPGGVPALLAAARAQHADAIAWVWRDERLSYRELHARAGRLMHVLRARGAGPGSRIALCLPRGTDLMVAVIACLRIGAAYVPLDIRQPAERTRQMIADARVDLALTAGVDLALTAGASLALTAAADTELRAALPCTVLDLDQSRAEIAAGPESAEDASVGAADLAYLIFTSGTTGRPKGVPITHAALDNLLLSMAHSPGMAAGDALLAVTTIAFDIAALELLLPLCTGARVVMTDAETAQDGSRLGAALDAHRITHLQATPATWRLLIESGWRGRPDLLMLCGGEALDAALARQLLERGRALWNLYGPTETTVWSAALRVEHVLAANTSGALPIGGAIANTWLAVVDAALRPVPPGVAGELLIGGQGLSPGYLERSELTAERFVTIADGAATVRAYRSGDRVRRRADGLLDFLGRVDHQIKLRGFRIEPGEIEAALNEHANVDQAVVGLWLPGADRDGDAVLVGWYRARDDHADAGETSAVLMHHLRQRLPAHMLPGTLVRVTRFPLTPSGKIDRRALPRPEATAPARAPGRPLRGAIELRLAEIWNELLPQRVASADDDFFALGGHSLLAARMIARVRAAFDLDPPLRLLFEFASLGAFAAQLAAMPGMPPAAQPISPADRSRQLPLSHAQRRQWVLAQLEPNSPLYNIPAAVRIRGQVSIPLLERSLRALGERHEGLRSVIDTRDGAPAPHLLPALEPAIEQIDLSDDAEAEREAHALGCLRAEANRPLDLSRGPLVRVLLVRLNADESLLLVVLHHILADAASMSVLVRDLSRIYRALRDGGATPLPPLQLQYVDYAAWQLDQDVSSGLAYWREQLAGAPALLDLPTDYKRPAVQNHAAGSVRLRMSASQRDALRAIARTQGATLFMTLLALFKLFLARYSSSVDIVIGTPVGHRPRPELDEVIGLFANTLALRTRLEGCRDFASVLARVRAVVLDGFAHQDVAFEQVVEQLNVPRSWAHAPLFQVMFLWQPAADPHAESFMPVPLDTATTKFDLTLTLAEDADGIAGRLDYRRDLFRPETADFMADALQALAQAVAFAPERPLASVSLASEHQRRLMRQWNDTAAQHDRSRCLHHPFEAQAAARPDAVALIDGVHRLSYRVLNERADALARHLRALGIGPEERVGICLERNADLVVALLATFKAGGAYVPLDPAYPPARLRLIMEDAHPRVLLTHHRGGNAELSRSMQAAGLPVLFLDREGAPVAAATSARAAAAAAPANAAYIIYTSGSTGRPKGVTIEHRQAAALLDWALRSFGADSLQGVLASTSICFDLSVFELFVPLAAGGSVVLARDALHLHELPAAGEVTLINTVPTAAAALLRLGPLPPSVNTVNVAGEPVPHALVQDLYAQPGVRAVYNLYGPSEDTTYSTGARLERPGPRQALMPIPIGRPIANTRAYVLDETMQPVAIGMTGELYLSGQGVARGYWARPDLTAERFVPNPCADGLDDRNPLAYRTGDRVRFNPDGQLEFLGRIDQQMKIRGFRIETGEVEAALQEHVEVRQAVVGAWLDDAGNKRLAAYVVPESGADVAGLGARLRGHLQQQLPDFMLPSAFVTLEAVPLLPNGKIDRGRLPRPQTSFAGDGTSAPRGDLERRLARIWESVLQRPCSDVHANFFELGGDSILAIQVVARARQDGIPIAPRDLFQHATIAALAAFASGRQDVATSSREPVRGEVPLTPAQHWFFGQDLAHPQHWNQSLLLDVARPLDEAVLARAVAALIEQHDVLRARFVQEHGVWRQRYVDEDVHVPPLVAVREASEDVAATVARHAEAAQASLDLAARPLWKMVYFELSTTGGPIRRLLIVCHHLLIDGVSWRILLDDLRTLYEQLAAGVDRAPAARTASCRDWVQRLQAEYPMFLEELPYWQAQMHGGTALPRDTDGGTNRMQDVATLTVALSADETRQLLHALPAAYKVRTEELLLTALAIALAPWAGKVSVPVMLEGHGREALASEPDLTRTLGWLTSFYPVLLPPVADVDADAAIRAVKTVLRAVPRRGLGYGVLRHLGPAAGEADAGDVSTRLRVATEIRFNYFGQADALFPAGGAFSPATEFTGRARHPEDVRDVLFELNAVVVRGELRLAWSYSSAIHRPETIAGLAQYWLTELRQLLAHCLSDRTSGGHVPSDFPLMQLDAGELDALLDDL